jgi:hypothetical protein
MDSWKQKSVTRERARFWGWRGGAGLYPTKSIVALAVLHGRIQNPYLLSET